MKSVTAREMQSIDMIAEKEFNISSLTLMENAGGACASSAMDMINSRKDKSISIFCGRGNNGGDGLVISRCLLKSGFDLTTYVLSSEDRLKKDPAVNFRLLKELKNKVILLEDKKSLPPIKELSGCGLIIDAIFGTGFKGRPEGLAGDVIKLINESGAKILSVDLPSGLDSTTGECEGECVRADETVTFGLPKTGFYRGDGPKFTGKITIKNIGFPESLLKRRRFSLY